MGVVGDIGHSRVCGSLIPALKIMGCEVTVVAPPTLLPARPDILGADRVTTKLDEALPDLDVVYMLRIQRERLEGAPYPSLREYNMLYGLTKDREHLMKPDALICHPGPINRGVELDSYMADHPKRSVILDQVYACCSEGAKMALLLKNAHVIDPQVGLNETADILVRDGKIVEIGQNLAMEKGVERDLGGKIVVPGLVDIHVHLREPGYELKEDIASGTRAAAHGGFTAVCCMPNTKPVIDNAVGVEYVKARAAAVGKCRVHVAGSCSQGLKGDTLSEMGDMVAHGAVAFTDDGRGVQGAGMMRRVMDYAAQFDRVVMSHCQDEDLVGAGQVNEGVVSTRLGMLGWPAEGEEIQIARDIAICRLTGCPLHIQHLTTARGLDLVRAAKAEGLPVTCEVTPHHLFLTEDAIGDDYNTFLKVNPPLRTAEDAAALVEGVKDGTVDAIVTDHAPHNDFEKNAEFELAPFGMIGLETALSLVITNLVAPGVISWERAVELMAVNPREILRVERVALEPGATADLTVIDPDAAWTVDAADFQSKAVNSGFLGAELTGRATDVYVGGYATMEDGAIVE